MRVGGQAQWDLDRLYISGSWGGYQHQISTVSTAGADHGHVGIDFEFIKNR